MSSTEITAEPGAQQIVVTRAFDAPRELVFRAYTDPELLMQWLGPRRLTMTVEQFEVSAGGIWRYIHREEDGAEHGFHGVFHGSPTPARPHRLREAALRLGDRDRRRRGAYTRSHDATSSGAEARGGSA